MIYIFILWVINGIATSYIASKRGRDPYLWFAIGVLFGLFGLLLLVILPDQNPQSDQEPDEIAIITPELPNQDCTNREWFCIDTQRIQHGLIDYKTLKALWLDGKLVDNSYVWSEGMAEWKKIIDLPDLACTLKEDN